jgi:transcriptional regulator with XRE-family HTH domain
MEKGGTSMEKMEFDKKRCMSAIYAIAKEKGVKIGDLEKEANVSTGYLSKLNKEENTSSPSIELLLAVARVLGVTIDMLIYSEYEGLSSNERYMLKFLDKLINDTLSGELQWEKETKKQLLNVNCDYMGNEAYAEHPLFEASETLVGDGQYRLDAYYYSRFFPEGDTLIAGDGFHAVLSPADAELYIMKVDNEEANMEIGYDQFEVYLVNRGGVKPLGCSDFVCGEVSRQIQNLYKVIVDADSNLGINDEVKSIIDLYMNEDEELPFN